MKKLKFTICIMMILLLNACAWDGGLRIIGVELVTHPNQLVYVIGIDNELNLEGGSILTLTRDNRNRPELRKMAVSPIERYASRIEHNIDFRTEGLFVVDFIWSHEFKTSFYVQVISIETLEDRIGFALE